MRHLLIAVAVLAFAMPAAAESKRKSCEDLRAEIEAKLKAKSVKKYTLAIVEKVDGKDARVVGSCDGGTRKIVYRRG